jgi:hypothetical protein
MPHLLTHSLDLDFWKERSRGDGIIWFEIQQEPMERGGTKVVMLDLWSCKM